MQRFEKQPRSVPKTTRRRTACSWASLSPTHRPVPSLARARRVADAEKLATPTSSRSSCERAKLEQLVSFFSRDLGRAIQSGQKAVELAPKGPASRTRSAINLHILGESLLAQQTSSLGLRFVPTVDGSFAKKSPRSDCDRTTARSSRTSTQAPDPDLAHTTPPIAASFAHAHNYSGTSETRVICSLSLPGIRAEWTKPAPEFERCRKLAKSRSGSC